DRQIVEPLQFVAGAEAGARGGGAGLDRRYAIAAVVGDSQADCPRRRIDPDVVARPLPGGLKFLAAEVPDVVAVDAGVLAEALGGGVLLGGFGRGRRRRRAPLRVAAKYSERGTHRVLQAGD